MRMAAMTMLGATMLSGCMTPPTGDAAATTTGDPVALPGECDVGAAQSLSGRPATAELAAEAQMLTGARSVRWLAPDSVATMDYRPDRLNIAIDRAGRVTGFRCG